MKLGDVSNSEAASYGKPLDGVRILAAEQMQALPYATQLLARLGAEVVKVEHPESGESGRGSMPAITDPDGRSVGATYLRNNFSKRSVGLDLKSDEGRQIFLDLVPHFDVVCENFKGGTMDRLGLGYDAVSAADPSVVYLSVSGFGNTFDSPYKTWPAYASIAEGMSGIYYYKTREGEHPTVNPMGAVGDISSALFGVIGILAALRHREATGEGQYVDISMFDAMVSMSDIVTNFHSWGDEREPDPMPLILAAVRCDDGYLTMQVGRPHQWKGLVELIGKPEWLDDPRFADRTGWTIHLDDVVRPAVEEWAKGKTREEASAAMGAAGVVTGPIFTPSEVVRDPHVVGRDMVVEMTPPKDDDPTVLVPGNPVRMSKVARGPESRVPWLGEHTDEVLSADLGLAADELARLREAGVIA